MTPHLKSVLEDKVIFCRRLRSDDFETLYSVASDPKIWEQHPNKDRFRRDVFEKFFEGAILSKGAYIVYDKQVNDPIGCSRFYDYDEPSKTILIGYTFFSRNYWGKGYNHRLKKLMLDHAFTFAESVIFHVGATNVRSQRSIEKLGIEKIAEQEVTYYGEQAKLNYIYKISRDYWITR